MPEYLAPGVFVEEVSFRQKSIEGVSTSTTGFVGPTRFGPVADEPPLLTSVAEFERIYGGLDQMSFNGHQNATHNYLAQAVRAYFAEGGKRLYVSRVFSPIAGPYPPTDSNPARLQNNLWTDGHGRWEPALSPPDQVSLKSRWPGAHGNFLVSLLFKQ
ncbi:MAG TPA: phage tail protein, partial [Chromatiaceae bacterium]|nr:phage tail protein [Chromatiaceae bacterium]